MQRIIETRKGKTGWRVTGKGPHCHPKASPEAVRLRVIKGYPVRAIAALLGCSTSTVQLRLRELGGVKRIKQQALDELSSV